MGDIEKKWDVAVNKRTQLASQVDLLKALTEEFDTAELHWHVSSEAQTDKINHLVYLLEPYMDKLP